jgi:DNA-directed RNA polymerase specialized sigma24 family protein
MNTAELAQLVKDARKHGESHSDSREVIEKLAVLLDPVPSDTKQVIVMRKEFNLSGRFIVVILGGNNGKLRGKKIRKIISRLR